VIQCIVCEGTVSFYTREGSAVLFKCVLRREVTVVGLGEGRRWWKRAVMPRKNLQETWSLQRRQLRSWKRHEVWHAPGETQHDAHRAHLDRLEPLRLLTVGIMPHWCGVRLFQYWC